MSLSFRFFLISFVLVFFFMICCPHFSVFFVCVISHSMCEQSWTCYNVYVVCVLFMLCVVHVVCVCCVHVGVHVFVVVVVVVVCVRVCVRASGLCVVV